MHAPKSPLTLFVEGVGRATLLAGIKVLLGSEHLSDNGAPPRIVIYPASGQYAGPYDKRAVTDLRLSVVARVWGASHDHAWDIHRRLLQAVKQLKVAGGKSWQPTSCDWEQLADATSQGVSVAVTFAPEFAIETIDETTLATVTTVNQTITNP